MRTLLDTTYNLFLWSLFGLISSIIAPIFLRMIESF